MNLLILSVHMPSDMNGQLNGRLTMPLTQIAGGGQLHPLAARAWKALVAAAKADGFDLTWTYGGTYRTLSEQQSLFQSRYTTRVLPGRPTKQWLGMTWYQLPGTAMAASPGTSNHGWSLAVDSAIGVSPLHATDIDPRLPWMQARAPDFGWSWESAETWHIRYVTGDRVPAAVLAYEAGLGVHPGPPPTPPGGQGDDVMPIRILRSMSDPPEFYAQFIGTCDAQGHSIEVQWSGPGDNPKCAQRMADLRAAGIQEQNIELAGLRNNVLHPRYAAADIVDGLHTWTANDFA